MTAKALHKALRDLADPAIAEHSQRFFKTGKGEYAEGDQFLGIRVPALRAQSKTFEHLTLSDTQKFLNSKFHEERMCAILLLVRKFEKGDSALRSKIYDIYMHNTQFINNWDLVDCSAHKIAGVYLEDKDRKPLYQFAKSKRLWERRIAIIATLRFIKIDQFDDTFELAKILLNDQEDLMHKAVGWMLREVGNRDRAAEMGFLTTHYRNMPRTMLRYAIEKFPEDQRKKYLKGLI